MNELEEAVEHLATFAGAWRLRVEERDTATNPVTRNECAALVRVLTEHLRDCASRVVKLADASEADERIEIAAAAYALAIDTETDTAADTETEAHRRALVALHVAGRARYGKAWDKQRPHYVQLATGGRTKSARECSTSELAAATRRVNQPSGIPADTRDVYRPRLELEPDGTYPFSKPRA